MADTKFAQLESTLGIWEREIGGRDLGEIDNFFLGPLEDDYPFGIIGIPKAIKEIESLTTLVISRNHDLIALPEWHGLEQLKHLEISYNLNLSALPEWQGLEQLKQLEIIGNSSLKTLPEWQGLEQLQQLNIGPNSSLSALPEWPKWNNYSDSKLKIIAA
jgi:Leucine-rich repeat (LRR) protein